MALDSGELKPAPLLLQHLNFFIQQPQKGPVIDLACGEGHNGLYLALKGLEVVLCDLSEERLKQAKRLAQGLGVQVTIWRKDLEREGSNPLEGKGFGGILVFRYLHRPLIPFIKEALKADGILIYETFTIDQPQFGKPFNPDHLLNPGELMTWFGEWEITHYFEGIRQDPPRAIAQIVCRKPLSSLKRTRLGFTLCI